MKSILLKDFYLNFAKKDKFIFTLFPLKVLLFLLVIIITGITRQLQISDNINWNNDILNVGSKIKWYFNSIYFNKWIALPSFSLSIISKCNCLFFWISFKIFDLTFLKNILISIISFCQGIQNNDMFYLFLGHFCCPPLLRAIFNAPIVKWSILKIFVTPKWLVFWWEVSHLPVQYIKINHYSHTLP